MTLKIYDNLEILAFINQPKLQMYSNWIEDWEHRLLTNREMKLGKDKDECVAQINFSILCDRDMWETQTHSPYTMFEPKTIYSDKTFW